MNPNHRKISESDCIGHRRPLTPEGCREVANMIERYNISESPCRLTGVERVAEIKAAQQRVNYLRLLAAELEQHEAE